jgi:hypothetical protein
VSEIKRPSEFCVLPGDAARSGAQTLSTDDCMVGIDEHRTAALHFQIRAALEDGGRNRSKAFDGCRSYDQAEAMSGSWEMEVREGNAEAALVTARRWRRNSRRIAASRFIDSHNATAR